MSVDATAADTPAEPVDEGQILTTREKYRLRWERIFYEYNSEEEEEQ